jgi:16S rRNA (cytosine967-C5)-methyltransferase
MSNAREIAYDITRRVNAEGAYLGLLLQYSPVVNLLDSRERAFLAEIVYGIQRHRNKLDFIIRNHSHKPLEDIDPQVLDLLRMGVYQLSEMGVPAHAAVNETVDLARKRLRGGAASFINAVLRNVSRSLGEMSWPTRDDTHVYLETIYSHPSWMVDYFIQCMDADEAEKLCAANNSVAGMTLRVNPLRAEREALISDIERQGGRAFPSPRLEEAIIGVSAPRELLLQLLENGSCTIQDESSMVVAHAVQAEWGEVIVDACSAPGGKATHLAQLGGDGCQVIAMDINARRLEALKNLATRLGLNNIIPVAGDASQAERHIEILADAVLVDAPCSGLGTLRRKPELKWRRRREDLGKMADIQLSILEGCSGIIREGGRLIYSVCTFTREETTDVLSRFLSRNPSFRLDDPSQGFPPSLRGIADKQGYLQIMPHLHDMDGMFIARLVNCRS